ncbi:CotH kinase family protein [Bacillus sp. FSL R5-0820]|uniref:CotH kinase family protein n=1 Tax=Bacillus TaxID=1386 RepID=UPI0002BE1D38|nr:MULTISPECIES: CotH kinase family protein [Bacillus]ANT56115.1 spore coat protein [Bacillus pumilus]EMI13855.1 spore coat protein h [Bacillus stratosphericus LAMA 585]MCA0117526.1 CotH kinase family protein [Bacillus sp. RSS_NA_20]MDJ0285211.1 CotH kinase family protein [Bacillus altitudinis]TYO51841.1 spore coat protein [Bacillus sp. Y3]
MDTEPLKQLDIWIHPKDLMELKKDVWNDEPVEAILKTGQTKSHIYASYRGSHIRKLKKKSYQIEYRKPKQRQGESLFHLNAEYNDPSFIRNRLSFYFFEQMGVFSPSASHVFLTINGRKEGIYLKIESVDELFLQKRQLHGGGIYYAVDDDANFSLLSSFDKKPKKHLLLGYEKKTGTPEHDKQLSEFIYFLNTARDDTFANKIEQYLDVTQYFRWLIGVVCTQNFDGFVHNYALYVNDQGRFQVMPWDYDATWGRDIHGEEMAFDYIPVSGFNTLTARLLDIPAFKRDYYALFQHVLDTHFLEKRLLPIIETWHASIEQRIGDDPYTKNRQDMLRSERELIRQYINKRRRYLQTEIKKETSHL